MPPSSSLPRPSDRWIPWYFIIFFVALVLILVPMGILAVRTNTGVVTEGAYEKGLAYNKSIQAAEQQKELNWQGLITSLPSEDGKLKVDFVLLDSTGQILKGADVKLWLVRPTQSGFDQKLDMIATSDGHYSANANLSIRGLWEARVSAMLKGQNYQSTKRIIIP